MGMGASLDSDIQHESVIFGVVDEAIYIGKEITKVPRYSTGDNAAHTAGWVTTPHHCIFAQPSRQ
jgi:hypothetical protein